MKSFLPSTRSGQLPVKPDMRISHGTIQGGMVAALLDEAMGVAPYYLGGKALRASAVSLTASWMRPALPGELFAIAGVLKQGRKVAFLAAELRGREGLVLATVNATAVPVVAS